MPTQSRSKPTIRGAKAQVRGAKTKGGRRAPVKSATDVPVLALVVGGILLVLFIGLFIYGAINSQKTPGPPAAAGIPCDQLQQTQVHYHVALQILDGGTLHPIPGGIGIQGGESSPSCYYWLHVHSANKNVIHIESPARDTFTLGDFFKVWDTWSRSSGGPQQRLDATHVSTLTIGPGQTLVAYYDLKDGKGAQVWDGDPNKIPLKAHEVITLEITPPTIIPPPSFTFPSGQ